MSDGYPGWNKPATKGDVIKLGVKFMTIANALGASHLRLLSGEETAARVELAKYFEAMQSLTEVLDEIGGGE